MGRITVFTSNDINSKQVLKALERRKLPYQEINLTDHPSHLADLVSLVDAPSVPHVFFNTRYVGGVERCMKELRRWDKSSRYKSPLDKYKAEVAVGQDPNSEHLAIPTAFKIAERPAEIPESPVRFQLSDNVSVTLRSITQQLKSNVPMDKSRVRGVLYPFCFTGTALVSTLQKAFHFSHEEAMEASTRLMQGGVIISLVDPKKGFRLNDHYCLQCLLAPEILNSFCKWPFTRSPLESDSGPIAIVNNLHKLLVSIELSCLDDYGQLDYRLVRSQRNYSVFQEAVCELQTFDLNMDMDIAAVGNGPRLAFALNLYDLMLRYGCLKIGIPTTEQDRVHFLKNVKFQLGDVVFSMKDWMDVILKGRSSKLPDFIDHISPSKPRWLTLFLAMHAGPHAGGSPWSLPFSRFQADGKEALDEQLQIVANVFCQDNHHLRADKKRGTIELSTLLKEAMVEMHLSDVEFLEHLLRYMGGKNKSDFQALLGSSKAEIMFMDHDLGFHSSQGPWYDRKLVGMVSAPKEGGIARVLRPFRSRKSRDKDDDNLSRGSSHASSEASWRSQDSSHFDDGRGDKFKNYQRSSQTSLASSIPSMSENDA